MKKLSPETFHTSQRGYFSGYLYNEMIDNDKIVIITADLGYGQFDKIRNDFPSRFFNVGAAEQSMLGIACGMALSGLIPFTYTITPFYWRAAETIRLYVNRESIPIKMIGGGRDHDYGHDDGFSHDASDINKLFGQFENIVQYFPKQREGIKEMLKFIITDPKPVFMSITR